MALGAGGSVTWEVTGRDCQAKVAQATLPTRTTTRPNEISQVVPGRCALAACEPMGASSMPAEARWSRSSPGTGIDLRNRCANVIAGLQTDGDPGPAENLHSRRYGQVGGIPGSQKDKAPHPGRIPGCKLLFSHRADLGQGQRCLHADAAVTAVETGDECRYSGLGRRTNLPKGDDDSQAMRWPIGLAD